jgi:hypothetical protein
MGISGCGEIILLKKTFNHEKTFQQEWLSVGRGPMIFATVHKQIDRKFHG